MFESFSKRVNGIDSSRQLALGISIGLVIGVLPKDNLLVGGLLVLLIISGANFVTGSLMCLAVSLVHSQLEPWMHFFGQSILNLDFFVVPLAKFMQLPLAAWTRLDNTVVVGAFSSGLACFLPVYLTSFYCFDKYRAYARQRIHNNKLFQWITDHEPTDIESTENRD